MSFPQPSSGYVELYGKAGSQIFLQIIKARKKRYIYGIMKFN